MKDLGMEKIIFDKFNTLVKKGGTFFGTPAIKESFMEA